MIENIPYSGEIPYQNVARNSSTEGYVEKLIFFLEQYLPLFPKQKQIQKDESEEDISEKLYNYLQRQRRFNLEQIEYPFEFQIEKSQRKAKKGHKRRVDFGVKLNTVDNDMELIYCIEAKKLPTGQKEREKEYVLGNYGGIQRFKSALHGIDDEGNSLPRNGMVGYVFEHTFEHWHDEINLWITQEGWSEKELLVKKHFLEIAKLESTHLIETQQLMVLDHYWVSVMTT